MKLFCISFAKQLIYLILIHKPRYMLLHPLINPLIILPMHIHFTIRHNYNNTLLLIPHSICIVSSYSHSCANNITTLCHIIFITSPTNCLNFIFLQLIIIKFYHSSFVEIPANRMPNKSVKNIRVENLFEFFV